MEKSWNLVVCTKNKYIFLYFFDFFNNNSSKKIPFFLISIFYFFFLFFMGWAVSPLVVGLPTIMGWKPKGFWTGLVGWASSPHGLEGYCILDRASTREGWKPKVFWVGLIAHSCMAGSPTPLNIGSGSEPGPLQPSPHEQWDVLSPTHSNPARMNSGT